MTKLNVQQLNAVWEQINEIAKHYTQFDVLRNHVVAITSELVSRKAFVFEDDQWVLSDREWADWIVSGEGKKYLDSSPGRKPRGFETPKWLDYILLVAIIALAGFVSNAVALAQLNVWAGWGIFLTSLGLVLSLATRSWEKLRTVTYYVGLALGVAGLIAALLSLGS